MDNKSFEALRRAYEEKKKRTTTIWVPADGHLDIIDEFGEVLFKVDASPARPLEYMEIPDVMETEFKLNGARVFITVTVATIPFEEQ